MIPRKLAIASLSLALSLTLSGRADSGEVLGVRSTFSGDGVRAAVSAQFQGRSKLTLRVSGLERGRYALKNAADAEVARFAVRRNGHGVVRLRGDLDYSDVCFLSVCPVLDDGETLGEPVLAMRIADFETADTLKVRLALEATPDAPEGTSSKAMLHKRGDRLCATVSVDDAPVTEATAHFGDGEECAVPLPIIEEIDDDEEEEEDEEEDEEEFAGEGEVEVCFGEPPVDDDDDGDDGEEEEDEEDEDVIFLPEACDPFDILVSIDGVDAFHCDVLSALACGEEAAD